MDLSFVIPTHNRPEILVDTVDRLGKLDRICLGDDAELIVVDNNSDQRVMIPPILDNGITVRVIRLGENRGAAARNVGAEQAQSPWVVMLDDDSSMVACPAAATLKSMPADVYAVGGEIHLPGGQHESGGLPEVVVGCGCAYRKDEFLALGGYDPAFDYYAEEYDLCAKIILGGGRVVHHGGLQFEHRKSTQGRSFDRIVHRLVRNNGWVIARYAPRRVFQDALETMIDRYGLIAHKEHAGEGYHAGLEELKTTIENQPCTEMSRVQWDRFVGIQATKEYLGEMLSSEIGVVQIVNGGKGEAEIRLALSLLGQTVISGHDPDAQRVIGTLSPGPMVDAKACTKGSISPWKGFEGADLDI